MFDEEASEPPQEYMQGRVGFSAVPTEQRIPTAGKASWEIQLQERDDQRTTAKLSVSVEAVSEVEGAAEWLVKLYDATRVVWQSDLPGEEVELQLENRPKQLELEVTAPKGAEYEDRVTITLEAWPDGELEDRSNVQFTAVARQSIMALKTSIGHERNVADSLASKAKGSNAGVFAILSPTNLRGYVLLEAMNTDQLKETVKGLRKARGLVEGETTFDEIDHFLTPKPLVSGIMEGDVVELVAGPFKGEKARVQQIDEGKEEITVELFEAMVPIPVTVRGDHVRVLEKDR
ncbi:MAG: transcription elongation factor Spt5 [Thermoplasmatota archaeon]